MVGGNKDDFDFCSNLGGNVIPKNVFHINSSMHTNALNKSLEPTSAFSNSKETNPINSDMGI